MREFILESDSIIDPDAVDFLDSREIPELLPVKWIYFNNHVKAVCFPDDCEKLSDRLADIDVEEICALEQQLLGIAVKCEESGVISLANLVWNTEDIYLDEEGGIHMICLPTILPESRKDTEIYMKRVYAMLEEMLHGREGSEEAVRQIEYRMEHSFGDWKQLSEALTRRRPEIDDTILLKSINTAHPQQFRIGDQQFVVGADPEQANGVIQDSDQVAPVHAIIGWNGINFYVYDLGSQGGTYVNDTRIAQNTEVPIGQGTVLKFGDCTFAVE
ncbi:MAG: FHA domain-containing protein [Eubacterium sp.]|nr:FHA domain-containing protein [Eubacterium sp.]